MNLRKRSCLLCQQTFSTQTVGMSTNSDHVTIIGKTTGRYRPRIFGIRQPDRLMHMYVIGQTGVGKTTFLHNLMRQDIAAGRGFCFIDPHGDLAGEIAASGN